MATCADKEWLMIFDRGTCCWQSSSIVALVAGDTKKASKAAKAVTKSSFKKTRKPRYSTTFHRPKTLSLARSPKYPRQR